MISTLAIMELIPINQKAPPANRPLKPDLDKSQWFFSGFVLNMDIPYKFSQINSLSFMKQTIARVHGGFNRQNV
jgi:hypothetical protein